MLKKFLPDEHVHRVFDIDLKNLQDRGIKAIITDLDNTLVAWDEANASPELVQWFETLQKKGFVVTIISNNVQKRVEDFAKPLQIPFIYSARKPLTAAFKRAIENMDVKREETVVVGDQIFTDVFGGNRLGLHTILVVPVAETDGFFTKFNRKMERLLLRIMRRKGLVYWEEKN